MRKLKIALGDLSYDNPLMKGNLYLPLGAGYLAAYAHKLFGDAVSIKIFKDPSALLDYAGSERPDFVGFSHYFWNKELNRLVSRKIRNMLDTSVTIVFGGPSIDSDPEMLLSTCQSYPDINAVVPNEGEQGFANIIEALLAGAGFRDALDGVAFEREGSLVSGRAIGLSTDLDTVPSP